MPSLKDIRLRIEATKNTQQITKAMKLVAAAKLRKAQHQIQALRPYAYGLMDVIQRLAKDEQIKHPFLPRVGTESSDTKPKLLLVVLTSDRGLCGGFNAQIIKFTDQFLKHNKELYEKIDVIFVGKKAAEFFTRRGVQAKEAFQKLDRDISYEYAANMAEKFMQAFMSGDYTEVKFIYNEFKSAISQKVTIEQIIPVQYPESTNSDDRNVALADFIFEPAPELILDQLLKKHFTVQTYRCLCESIAAEHGARMTAMENATNNCKELIHKLTLTYNKLRQEKITTELIEIVSGAEAL
ncbi:MAG: ATP synthase F1 subunit gamma [Bdellovibrionaceae bacterium]|jgi:F-type H+-transporting ATPase subunit gamma|nr:ATP synthase F1 subunit gamma [Pseudobdellovibrionaceae bacterium]